jgi:prepilin-type N-terminal cleavage/methylation domain-containing protein
MKNWKMKNWKQLKTQMQSNSGFTFLEVLVSLIVVSVGILGLASTVNTVGTNQRHADETTEAMMIASDHMENIKRLTTNEPTGGAYGFPYFVDDDNGFLKDYNIRPDIHTRSRQETNTEDPDLPVGVTRTTTVSNYIPVQSPPLASEDFDTPLGIHMVDVEIIVEWTNSKGSKKNVSVSTVLQRRQLIGN